MRNIKVIGAAIIAIGLTGCQLPVAQVFNDMSNNNFVGIVPDKTPLGLSGVWTGSMGPYLASMLWQQNGYGYLCYSYGTANVVQKVKYKEGVLFIQDGTKLVVEQVTKQSVTVHAPYFAGKDTVFYTDLGYQNASPFCAKALAENASNGEAP